MRTVEDWKLVLRTTLREAMRTKDPDSVSVIRETLAAIDNAEAPDLSHAPAAQSQVIAGATQGLGAGDIMRRQLSPAEVTSIIEREVHERRDAAASYVSLGRATEAAVLSRQADVLHQLISRSGGDVEPLAD
jgi:uncharacterized protein YqeY